MTRMVTLFASCFLLLAPCFSHAAAPQSIPLADGFSQSSINTVIFRHNSLDSFNGIQYAAFYDRESHLVLAKRKLSESFWQIKTTTLTGNTKDAHNTISLAVDSAGIVHLAWDHHGNNLNYARTTRPDSLDLTDKLTTDGIRETQVTYPEFYHLPDGDLLLLYRVGASGNGDLILKRYHPPTQTWTTIQPNLIAGEGRQNAYPEFCVDGKGTLHLAWSWRRTPDVATNHDLCYARSTDGGKTWTNSKNQTLPIPITASTSEIALSIPENSNLINQTTITADDQGHPYIATYFNPLGQPPIPQFIILYHDGQSWHTSQVTHRTTPFSLAGGGTKRIPISRPLILPDSTTTPPHLHIIYRDAERQDHITLATTTDISKNQWTLTDLTTDAIGSWEPTHDPSLWSQQHILNLFVQTTDQLDNADTLTRPTTSTPISILQYKP